MQLRGGPWTMDVRPDRGGRITSLTLRGEELLEQGIGVDRPHADGFVEAGAQGWDEMVPNVEPCIYLGLQLPDHGEAWRQPWRVESQTESSVTMSAAGRLLPWTLQRHVELMPGLVRASYVYGNTGTRPFLAYWSGHALFKYMAGVGIGRIQVEPPGPGTSAKTFLEPGSVDRVTLTWTSGASVEVAWDSSVTPYVGVWVCNGDLGGYRQIAIEPATGGRDRPDPVEPPPLVQPGESLHWWLEIRDGRVTA